LRVRIVEHVVPLVGQDGGENSGFSPGDDTAEKVIRSALNPGHAFFPVATIVAWFPTELPAIKFRLVALEEMATQGGGVWLLNVAVWTFSESGVLLVPTAIVTQIGVWLVAPHPVWNPTEIPDVGAVPVML
jgi:hypothetical protein